MREAFFQSKCPECENVDILSESEIQEKVHCQRCYHHYDFRIDVKPSFDISPFGVTEIQYIRGLITMDKVTNEYEKQGMNARIDQKTSMHEFTEKLLSKLDDLEL